MSDNIDEDPAPDASPAREPRTPDEPTIARRYAQRNLAERLFPGPSPQMSEQVAQRIESLIRDGGNEAAIKAWRERQEKRASRNAGSHTKRDGRTASGPPAVEAPVVSTPDDLAELSEKLEQQNELLRALLASSIDTQSDARSTAQNSRTFAWAGTVIALLTLIATVISIVAAVKAN